MWLGCTDTPCFGRYHIGAKNLLNRRISTIENGILVRKLSVACKAVISVMRILKFNLKQRKCARISRVTRAN